MGIASSDKNTIRKMSEIEAVIYDRFLQKSPPTRRLILFLHYIITERNLSLCFVCPPVLPHCINGKMGKKKRNL